MALSRSLWLLTFVVVRAQKSLHTDETQSKFQSYDPSQVCFNPQYDPYFKNDLLSTSPVPKPNIYYNNKLESQVTCPKSSHLSPKSHFPPFISPWAGFLSGSFVPMMYIPSLPTSGHVDHRTIKYLKSLKYALDANPLLATRNRTAFPKNHVEIKIAGFPPVDALPEAFSKSVNNAEQRTETRKSHRADEIKAQKMASYLKDYNRRRRKRENDGSNVYPLPKFVYNDHRIPEPTTFYDKNLFLSEIFTQNI